ncbi:MAG: surface-adhesin E family protein [Gallionellaceae bacterium]
MRKVILMVALMVVSGSAMAEWVLLDDHSGEIAFYVDVNSIVRTDGFATMLVMSDFIKKENSIKSNNQYDCKDGKSRKLTTDVYSGHMGAGDVVYSKQTPNEWSGDTSGLLKRACGIK